MVTPSPRYRRAMTVRGGASGRTTRSMIVASAGPGATMCSSLFARRSMTCGARSVSIRDEMPVYLGFVGGAAADLIHA